MKMSCNPVKVKDTFLHSRHDAYNDLFPGHVDPSARAVGPARIRRAATVPARRTPPRAALTGRGIVLNGPVHSHGTCIRPQHVPGPCVLAPDLT